MTRPAKHSLSLTDRGHPHIHRWLPKCECGWTGIPLRDKGRAEEQYRGHVKSATAAQQKATKKMASRRGGGRPARIRRARGNTAGPRPLTPLDQLPDELR